MRTLLDPLISPFQGAFLPNRSIQDNLLIVQEILNIFQNPLIELTGLLSNLTWKKHMTVLNDISFRLVSRTLVSLHLLSPGSDQNLCHNHVSLPHCQRS